MFYPMVGLYTYDRNIFDLNCKKGFGIHAVYIISNLSNVSIFNSQNDYFRIMNKICQHCLNMSGKEVCLYIGINIERLTL